MSNAGALNPVASENGEWNGPTKVIETLEVIGNTENLNESCPYMLPENSCRLPAWYETSKPRPLELCHSGPIIQKEVVVKKPPSSFFLCQTFTKYALFKSDFAFNGHHYETILLELAGRGFCNNRCLARIIKTRSCIIHKRSKYPLNGTNSLTSTSISR